jgi:hypothetical protein
MTFRTKLTTWMEANPGLKPQYTIWIKSPSFASLIPGNFMEFGTMDDPTEILWVEKNKNPTKIKSVKIKSLGLAGTQVGPLFSAEIELPISYLKTTETKRDEKIEEIITDGIQRN